MEEYPSHPCGACGAQTRWLAYLGDPADGCQDLRECSRCGQRGRY